MNEHDIFKELVYHYIPSRIDDYIIECHLLDDDFRIRQGRKEIRMIATSVDKPSQKTLACILPFESIDEYINRKWLERFYAKEMKGCLFEMLHRMVEWINSVNRGFELDESFLDFDKED